MKKQIFRFQIKESVRWQGLVTVLVVDRLIQVFIWTPVVFFFPANKPCNKRPSTPPFPTHSLPTAQPATAVAANNAHQTLTHIIGTLLASLTRV